MTTFIIGAIVATLLAILAVTYRVEIASFFQKRVEGLEDIVGEFTSLDERLGAYIEREQAEIDAGYETIQEAEADISAAQVRTQAASRSQYAVRQLAGGE